MVVTDPDAAHAAGHGWFRHDPRGWFDRIVGDHAMLAGLAAAGRGGDAAIGLNGQLLHRVDVPLCCTGREVGRLVLLAAPEASPDLLKNRLAAIAAALAVLLAAAEHGAAQPLAGVLSGVAFRARVASELALAERSGDAFSVLHLTIACSDPYDGDEMTDPWAPAGVFGEALAGRLRKSDVVGLLRPDHLAVLFVATDRLGARIAARRIRELLPTLTPQPSCRAAALEEPRMYLRVFPGDGADAESLCEIQEQTSAATAQSGARMGSR
jgi:hypothetical protein